MTAKKVQESASVQLPTKRPATVDNEGPSKVVKTDENTCVTDGKITELEMNTDDKKTDTPVEVPAAEEPLVEEPVEKESAITITVTETTVDVVDAKIDGETEAVKVTVKTVNQVAEVGAALNDDIVPAIKTTESKVEVVIPKSSPANGKEQSSVKTD